MSRPTSFADMLGLSCAFYGVDNHQFRLARPGGLLWTFEAMEDELDSYNSSLREVRTVPVTEAGIFFATPVATVIPTEVDDTAEGGDFSGYVFTDMRTGHVWLRVGTHHTEDNYQSFFLDYTPSGEQHPSPTAPPAPKPPGTLCA